MSTEVGPIKDITLPNLSLLRKLWQGQGTVAFYAAHICQHIATTLWNEAVQQYLFRWNLQEETKDELVQVDNPRGLDTLINLVIRSND